MNGSAHRRAGGFTLLELLIALAIFGLLSVMSYSGLKSVLDQHAGTDEAADRLGELQKLYLVMQRDIEQIVPRRRLEQSAATAPQQSAARRLCLPGR